MSSLSGLLFLLNAASLFGQISTRQHSVQVNSDPPQRSAAHSSLSLDSPYCLGNSQHLLLLEDSTIVTAKFISMTRDGNFLIPGYYYPNRGVYYNVPYLTKCTASGDILWSKSYPNRGIFASDFFFATRIKELHNGDLLMTGEIGVPGTDNRREMAVWRLDKNGNQIWAESYESNLWTNPITGSDGVTGIEEDAAGNIFLSGNLNYFNAPNFAFLLKISSKGTVLWDKSYSIYRLWAFGLILLPDRLLLVGRSGPQLLNSGLQSFLLWCVRINPADGNLLTTKAFYADFDQQSFANSFGFANTSVALLDNGQIAVCGTANSDYLAYVGEAIDTIRHSIVANFTREFDFAGGIMLASKHLTNYYNTLATEHPNGRISYTRFSENQNLYNEDIIYGNIQNNRVYRERIYHEENRSGATVSNFLFYQPSEDVLIQSFIDSTTRKGGIEIIKLDDNGIGNNCSGLDTNLTFIQPYFMKSASMQVDSIVANTFHFTYHNFVNQGEGHLTTVISCQLPSSNAHFNPTVSLNKEATICEGSSRQLAAGPGYSQYLWSNGSTDSSILVSGAGRYWVTVTDQYGCKGSDTSVILATTSPPIAFLPHDTSLCPSQNLSITPLGSYQNYVWNDFSNGPTLTISQPGVYWLQVTDSNNCVGIDSIQVNQTDCLHRLLVPSAFTPNGDGLNDVFKPLLLGNVTGFHFTIYNRWGEKVFETQTLGKGWDGKLNGASVGVGVFVWFCEYQIAGGAEKIDKGTVTLVK